MKTLFRMSIAALLAIPGLPTTAIGCSSYFDPFYHIPNFPPPDQPYRVFGSPFQIKADTFRKLTAENLADVFNDPKSKAQLVFQRVRENQTPRDPELADNVIRLIQGRESDELLIVLTGYLHAADIYFNLLPEHQKDTGFLAVHIAEGRRLGELDRQVLRKLRRRLECVTHSFAQRFELERRIAYREKEDLGSTISKEVLASFYLALAAAYKLNEEHPNSDIAMSVPGGKGSVVIGDYHTIDRADVLPQMPGAETLRSLGFRKVRFASEGLEFGAQYSLDVLGKNIRFNPTVYSRLLGEDYSPRASSLNMEMEAYGKHLEGLGFEVEVTGIEPKGTSASWVHPL